MVAKDTFWKGNTIVAPGTSREKGNGYSLSAPVAKQDGSWFNEVAPQYVAFLFSLVLQISKFGIEVPVKQVDPATKHFTVAPKNGIEKD